MFGPKNELLHESWTWCLAAASGGFALLILLISCWKSRRVLASQKFHHIVAMISFVALPGLLWSLTKLQLTWICIPIGGFLVLGSLCHWCCTCSLFLRSREAKAPEASSARSASPDERRAGTGH
eukprot:g25006.t1